jgi:hypothetical protein
MVISCLCYIQMKICFPAGRGDSSRNVLTHPHTHAHKMIV